MRNGSYQPHTWTVEPLEGLSRSKGPSSFTEIGYDFRARDELSARLGHHKVRTNTRHTAARTM